MDNMYLFNPIQNKVPAGPSKTGTEVCYTLKISRFAHAQEIFFILIDDKDNSIQRIKMPLYANDEGYYTYKVNLKYSKPGLWWYYFEVANPNHKFYLCKTQTFDIEPVDKVQTSYAQVVYSSDAVVDKKFKQGVIYHIFVDRFRSTGEVECKDSMVLRSDWGGCLTKHGTNPLILNQECFGGNLAGITEKIPYIKELGVSTIYLSPIFESYSYHKYDTADYENVDSMFGGNKALDELIAAAKKHGIGIVLDGVFNHVGSDSIYFNKLSRFKTLGAYQSKKSKYYDWFEFENYPNKYSSWWGIDTLPQFNETSKTMQEYFTGPKGVIAKYMEGGILGFRLDVVDELTDGYLDKICKRIKACKADAPIIGEVWEDAATKIAYGIRRHYFNGSQLDSVMNYPLKNAIIDYVSYGNAEGLQNVFCMIEDHYPLGVRNALMNFLGTHDTKRIFTVLTEALQRRGQSGKATQALKIASAIQYCSRGVPAVFYGDEIAVNGGDAPLCRVCYPWGSENKEVLEWYRKLGILRKSEVFASGNCKVLLAHMGVFIFERERANERIVIAANCGYEDFKLTIKEPMTNFESGKTEKESLLLKPFDFVILKC